MVDAASKNLNICTHISKKDTMYDIWVNIFKFGLLSQIQETRLSFIKICCGN